MDKYVIGIILEANPLHNGHKYLINYIKNHYKDATIVAVTSTSFTMRGEVSVINKYDKTKYLLDAGCNLVLELPFMLAMQSGDYFAYNAVKILNLVNITHIVCGCETSNLSLFEEAFNISNTDTFNDALKQKVKEYNAYKVAYYETLKAFNASCDLLNNFNSPNFTLAYQYFRAIKSINPNIILEPIKRTNNYYGNEESNNLNNHILSGTSLRKLIMEKGDYLPYIPFNESFINEYEANQKLLTLFKYKIMNYIDSNNEILNYINHKPIGTSSYDLYIEELSNKGFTKTRIRRTILHHLLDTKDNRHGTEYLRILGFDENGLNHIQNLSPDTKKIMFASIKEPINNEIVKEIAETELKATKLYSLITNNDNLIMIEYKFPIRKDK